MTLCIAPASGYTFENSRYFKRAISAIYFIANVTYTNKKTKISTNTHKSI